MEVTDEQLLELHRWMLEGRMFELSICKIKGNYHPAVGEEAVIIGTFYNLRDEDIAVPHFRGSIIIPYMRGAPIRRLYAGIMGKDTNYNHGRWRGDIWGPVELNIIGMFSGILGSNIALASGAAMAAKMKNEDNVAVVTFGDGTSNTGMCHEAINMASVLKFPVVFVCQNNQYAVSTPACRGLGCQSVADRAIGYGIAGVKVDGNDVVAVHLAVQEAVARARSGEGPTLIEALTYRVLGHWVADPADYRSEEEVNEWKKKDPIEHLQKDLIGKGLLTEADIEEMTTKMEKKIADEMKTAEEDPWPGEEHLGIDDVFAPAG
jgi:TPP-dependent pyruvate/acetoin dehydrogenase alpha subunit